jgi:hypothetical protein
VDARLNSTSGRLDAGSVLPSARADVVMFELPSGIRVVPPAAVTPGMARRRSNQSS